MAVIQIRLTPLVLESRRNSGTSEGLLYGSKMSGPPPDARRAKILHEPIAVCLTNLDSAQT